MVGLLFGVGSDSPAQRSPISFTRLSRQVVTSAPTSAGQPGSHNHQRDGEHESGGLRPNHHVHRDRRALEPVDRDCAERNRHVLHTGLRTRWVLSGLGAGNCVRAQRHRLLHGAILERELTQRTATFNGTATDLSSSTTSTLAEQLNAITAASPLQPIVPTCGMDIQTPVIFTADLTCGPGAFEIDPYFRERSSILAVNRHVNERNRRADRYAIRRSDRPQRPRPIHRTRPRVLGRFENIVFDGGGISGVLGNITVASSTFLHGASIFGVQTNLDIENGQFVGDGTSTSPAIDSDISNTTVVNDSISGYAIGIRATGPGGADVNFSNNHIVGNGTGITLDGTDGPQSITRNVVSNNEGDGIVVGRTTGSNLIVSNNVFSLNGHDGLAFGTSDRGPVYNALIFTLTGNQAVLNADWGIDSVASAPPNIVITNGGGNRANQNGAGNCLNLACGTGLPTAPTGVRAAASSGQATVHWIAPVGTGGSPITGYVVTPYIGTTAQSSRTFTSPALSEVVTGLTNGTKYTFKVAATNVMGTGPQSAANAAITVGTPTKPSTPLTPSAVPGNGQATVKWTAPASNSSANITGYVVTPYLGGVAQPAHVFNAATTQLVTGLTNGHAYTFKIAATNAAGTGLQSVATVAITVGAPTAPTAPSAIGGVAKATVHWTASGSNNGSAITGYVITPYLGTVAQPARTFTSTATTQTVTGLMPGHPYTFKIAAKNARGVGRSRPRRTGSHRPNDCHPRGTTSRVRTSGQSASTTAYIAV